MAHLVWRSENSSLGPGFCSQLECGYSWESFCNGISPFEYLFDLQLYQRGASATSQDIMQRGHAALPRKKLVIVTIDREPVSHHNHRT